MRTEITADAIIPAERSDNQIKGYAPNNSVGRFDKKTTSLKANVPNINFFLKSQIKNLKIRLLHIPTAYYIITAHTSYS